MVRDAPENRPEEVSYRMTIEFKLYLFLEGCGESIGVGVYEFFRKDKDISVGVNLHGGG